MIRKYFCDTISECVASLVSGQLRLETRGCYSAIGDITLY